METRQYIKRLQMVIRQLYGCASTHLSTQPVKELFQGKTIWEGQVEVFAINHPKAPGCYAWSLREGDNDEGGRFVALLRLPPINSPQDAVKALIVSDLKKLQSSSAIRSFRAEIA